MYPNHKAIKRIENGALRVALYTATGRTRKRLEKAFPHCYSKNIEKLQIPFSIIKDSALKEYGKWGESDAELERLVETDWINNLEEFDVPVAFMWNDNDPGERGPVPMEVRRQLEGQPLRPRMTVSYLGEQFIVCCFCTAEKIALGETMTWGGLPSVGLVHARFIDFDS